YRPGGGLDASGGGGGGQHEGRRGPAFMGEHRRCSGSYIEQERGYCLPASQPQVWPSFWAVSHCCRGAKYSSTAEASICSPPVSSCRVCCQGWLAPWASMAWNFLPASALP